MRGRNGKGTLIVGGCAVLSILGACSTTDNRVGASAEIGSIYELQSEWDEIEGRVGRPNDEFRKQYAKSLQTLNNVIAEREQYKEAVSWSRH